MSLLLPFLSHCNISKTFCCHILQTLTFTPHIILTIQAKVWVHVYQQEKSHWVGQSIKHRSSPWYGGGPWGPLTLAVICVQRQNSSENLAMSLTKWCMKYDNVKMFLYIDQCLIARDLAKAQLTTDISWAKMPLPEEHLVQLR